MAKEKLTEELSVNQKLLMSLSGEQSVRDWGNELGNERLRQSRVMLKKLIRTGHDDVLDVVAEYLGTHLVRESSITEEVARLEKLYPMLGPASRERVRESLRRK